MPANSIHYICRGNTYRSRLAEAYTKKRLSELKIKEVDVTSSGIKAYHNLNGPITWVAMRILTKEALQVYMSYTWTQLTQEILDKNELIVFMREDILEHCKTNFEISKVKYRLWEIEDIAKVVFPEVTDKKAADQLDLDVIHESEEVFEKIKAEVDNLIGELFLA